MPDSTPERDRYLARQPRYGARHADGVSSVVDTWLRGSEAKRLKRYRHIVAALHAALGGARAAQVRPVDARQGRLTLEVDNPILMHEIRNHDYQLLIAKLVEHGTGIDRVQLRVARRG